MAKSSKHIFIFLIFISGTGKAFTFSDTTIIKSHLIILTKTQKYRTHDNVTQLNKTANYIQSIFKQYTDSVSIQEFSVNGQIYKNIVCSFGTANKKKNYCWGALRRLRKPGRRRR